MDINERLKTGTSVLDYIFLSPWGVVDAPDVRRQSRLLSSLLLVVILSGIFMTGAQLLFPETGTNRNTIDIAISLTAILLLTSAYFLNRSGRYVASAGVSVIVMAAAIFLASYPSPSGEDIGMLYFLAIPILFSGILLPLPFNIQFDLVIITGMAVFKILVPDIALDQVPIVTVSVLAGFSLLAAAHRNRLECDRRSVLAASELRFRTLLNNAPEAVLLVEYPGGGILEANRTAESLLGITRDVLLSSDYTCLFTAGTDDGEIAEFTSALRRAAEGSKPSVEWRYFRPEHPEVLFRTHFVTIPSDSGPCVRISMTDITVNKRMENSLRYLATHDSLTGLPNRNLLFDRLSTALVRAGREGRSVTVLFLDLDDFKQVNETLDHLSGDAVLRVIAARFKLVLREDDVAARLGGDEFAFLLDDANPDSDASGTTCIIRRLLETISQPVRIQDRDVSVTASIGASRFPENGRTARILLQNADTALFQAKALGKGTYCFFKAGMRGDPGNRPALVRELQEAANRNDLVPVYQPQTDSSTGCVGIVEVLVRWRHPVRGLLLPDEFLPEAEEAGLGAVIDEKVLLLACRQLKEWHDDGNEALRVSVNLGRSFLSNGNPAIRIREILLETGVSPESIELEVSETVVSAYPDQVGRFFTELRGSGIRFAVDGFGSGSSPLGALASLPIDVLKLDCSRVRDRVSSDRELTVVRGLVKIAADLGLTTVAVGVETREELEAYVSFGVDRLQGYVCGPPVPAREIGRILHESIRGITRS